MKFILASASQRRQQLLKYLIDDYQVITADINEEELAKLARTPQEMVMGLARAKAKKVWDIICNERLRPVTTENSILLAADTTVIIPQSDSWQSIGKPKDETEAKRTLQMLRQNQHQVYTGICLMISSKEQRSPLRSEASRSSTAPKIISDFDMSTVTFGNFSDEAIEKYIATGTVLDKAGAYAIQDIGKEFGITVEGSYSSVVGLPMERLVRHFDRLEVEYKRNWRDKLSLQFSKSNSQ